VGQATLARSVAGAALAAGASQVILVGPERPELADLHPPGGLFVTREDPPGGGPVPALRAGLALASSDWVLVLAADLPFLAASHLRALLAASGDRAGAVLADDTGRAQWLAGCWRTAALRAALDCYRGASLGGLLGPLAPELVSWPAGPGEPPPWLDCDTPADLAAARAWPQPAGPGDSVEP
jgi:molybdenum cofactor guanylyltransferase